MNWQRPGKSPPIGHYDPSITTPRDDDFEDTASTDNRVGDLRGAGVAPVDFRKLATALGLMAALALLVLAVAFAVAGAINNSQIDSLRAHGVRASITVTSCIGNLGGSGSNAAGYDCTGTYRLDGHTYTVSITTTDSPSRGSTIPAIAVAGNPPLIRTIAALADQRASNGVYVLPGALALGDLILVIIAMAIRKRRRTTATGSSALG